MDNQLKSLWEPISEGTERIEDWWQRNGDYIQSITHVDTEDEVLIWCASYYRYGMFLYNDGYSKQSLGYIDKALDILDEESRQTAHHLPAEGYRLAVRNRIGGTEFQCWHLRAVHGHYVRLARN